MIQELPPKLYLGLGTDNPPTFSHTVLLPQQLDIPAWGSADVVSGMTFTRNVSASAYTGGYESPTNSSDAPVNNYVEYWVDLSAGTYKVDVFSVKNNWFGIVTVYIDGVSIGTIDLYAASISYDNLTTISSVALAGGPHKIQFKATSKNTSSSAYGHGLQTFSLTRTGA